MQLLILQTSLKEDFKKIRNLVINGDNIKGFYLCQRNYTHNNKVAEFVYAKSKSEVRGFLGWWNCWIIRLFAKDEKISRRFSRSRGYGCRYHGSGVFQ